MGREKTLDGTSCVGRDQQQHRLQQVKLKSWTVFYSFSYFSGMFQQATPTSFPLLQKVSRPSCLGLSEVLLLRATIKFYLLKHDGLEKKTTHQEPEKPAFISMTTAWTLLPT